MSTECNEKLKVLGYELKLIPILEFKAFYDNCNTFNDFSRKAFLKALRIPPTYFLEQPESTQSDLLKNKEDLLPTTKIKDKHIAILEKDNMVLNCIRVDRNDIENLYERLLLSDKDTKKLVPVKDFVKEGFSSSFVPHASLEEGRYNLGIFINYPLLLNKLPEINIGLFYVPKKGEDNYKNVYLPEIGVNFDDYQSLELLLSDVDSILKDVDGDKFVQVLKDSPLLREPDEVLIRLHKDKVIPKGYIKKISKFISKNELLLPTLYSFTDLLVSYEANLNSYKQVINLRNCIKVLEKITKLKE